MYKAIIFDFFGVFCPDITLEWFKKNVPEYELKLPDFQAICTRSDYGKLNKEGFYSEISQLTDIPINQVVDGVEAEVIINDQLVAWTHKLKEGGRITACLSNGTHEWTLDVISRHGLARLFDEIILSGDLGIVKPDSRIYLHTLQKLNIEAAETIFVDDREVNVNAAKECGINGMLFTNTARFIAEFEHLTAQE